MSMIEDAIKMIETAITRAKPDAAVEAALAGADLGSGKLVLVAAGKAAWQMAAAASRTLGERISGGVVITKYGHAKGSLPGVTCREAAHPVPDEKGFAATEEALQLVSGLTEEDLIAFPYGKNVKPGVKAIEGDMSNLYG